MMDSAQQPEAGGGTASSIDQLADENALLRAALAELQARLHEQEGAVDKDPLTGLPNRQRFDDELARIVAQVNRHGTPAALLLVDLDGLGAVNASHGQVAGDAALIHVARLLAKLIRTSDVAARVGGDEFALILHHLDGDSAIDTAERIGRCIAAEPLDLGSTQVRLEATIGVATILAGDRAEEVLRRAESNAARARDFSA